MREKLRHARNISHNIEDHDKVVLPLKPSCRRGISVLMCMNDTIHILSSTRLVDGACKLVLALWIKNETYRPMLSGDFNDVVLQMCRHCLPSHNASALHDGGNLVRAQMAQSENAVAARSGLLNVQRVAFGVERTTMTLQDIVLVGRQLYTAWQCGARQNTRDSWANTNC